jgi:hypothetical protein
LLNDGRVPPRITRLLMAVLLSLAAAGLAAAGAGAENVGTLDAQAGSRGHVVQDAAGTAYIAWTRKSVGEGTETPEFCKVPKGGRACTTPLALPIPAPAESVDGPSGAFPVLGAGATVYVVVPRYVKNDVLLYTSTDGGATFGAPQDITGAYPNKTGPDDVILSGSEFLIGAENPGLGFSAFNTSGEGLGDFGLEEPGPGGVADATMGLDSAGNPVQAWFNLSSPQYTIDYDHYNGSGSKTTEADWTGAQEVTKGYVPSLAGGAAGLFLLSQDFTTPSESYAKGVDVRKYSGSSFGPPLHLFTDKETDLYAGGTIAESPAGHIAVVWPEFYGVPQPEMKLLISTNGGASFTTEPNVAGLGSAYSDFGNASLSLGDNNEGWVTFLDSAGLQLANLSSGALEPKETTTHSTVGTDTVTLKGPTSCVRPGQKVTVTLTVKSAKRKHKVVLKIYQVIFRVDNTPFKTELRESVRKTGRVNPNPFTASVLKTFTAGSKHTISAQAFISERHGRHASRTLRVSFLACS